MKTRIGVLMGGPSSERDISIKSGKAVLQALQNRGLAAVPVELDASSANNSYSELAAGKIRSSNIDIAFIALHGEFGEDGRVQAVLEEMNIPYTGSKVTSSRLGMDKISSKNVFKSNNIPMPRHMVISRNRTSGNTGLDKEGNLEVYFKELNKPIVVKPSDGGSSIGLSIIDSEKDFTAALQLAFRYSYNVIIEEYIRGREMTIGILENKALPVIEIIPKNRFFDFEAKYVKGLTEYEVPAKLGKKQYLSCQALGLAAHNALGARSFSRVDMILNREGEGLVLEVNTIPGLTQTSLLPKAALAAGIDFEELVFKILESAIK